MPHYTLGQAAKATGKSKPTISNAIKKGWISAIKNEKGHFEIDVSELHRVYPIKIDKQSNEQLNVTPPNTENLNEVIALRAEIKGKDALLQERGNRIDELKEDRELIKGLITNQSDQATKEIEALRIRVEQAETDKNKALQTARHWKNEASKSWYKKLFG